MLKTSSRQEMASVAMARLDLLKSNGYKLIPWGHKATTYLCVGSLGFQGLANNNKITINANVKSATIHSRSFDEKHLQDHEESIIQHLVVNLPMV